MFENFDHDEPNGEIKHVISSNVGAAPKPVIEFKYRSGIEAEELAELVNDGWEIHYQCFLVPPQTVGLFVVLRRYVE
ncbi:hypothetical protein LCGC14_2388230 [marine sediment metagenome]|uniref:DUF4177 domain-containing protein n=1 Tax=marine sediment metagenome TaxID=412755 RepID=A0A0F9CL12_9ZZZZ